MHNNVLFTEADKEYFIRMMLPQIRDHSKAFEEEEERELHKLLRSLENKQNTQLVIVGAGSLSYIEVAFTYNMSYIAVEPLINLYLQKQIRFIVGLHNKIILIDRALGTFHKKRLGTSKNILAFIFNVLAYIPTPEKIINQYIKKNDIIFIVSWNIENCESLCLKKKYFGALNACAPLCDTLKITNKAIANFKLDDLDLSALKYCSTYKRIKNKITDILIIYC